MRTNFEIEDNYAIQFQGNHIDLHNNFDFEGITENATKTEIRLEFKKSNCVWVSEGEYEHLTFKCKYVSYKYFEEGDTENYPEDAKCLGEITFFPSTIRDVHDSISLQKEPNENDDLIFHFEDGKIIRVNCEHVELIVKIKVDH